MPVPKGFKERKLRSSAVCAAGSMRIKKLSKNRRIVLCCPRGHYDPDAVAVINGRRVRGFCNVGTVGVAIQERKKG